MMSISSPGPRTRRTYDHRLREHVVRAGARSLVQAPVAVPQLVGLRRAPPNPRCVLRRAAQHTDATRGLLGPDAG